MGEEKEIQVLPYHNLNTIQYKTQSTNKGLRKINTTYWRMTSPFRASSWSTILLTVSLISSTAAIASRRFSNNLKIQNKTTPSYQRSHLQKVPLWTKTIRLMEYTQLHFPIPLTSVPLLSFESAKGMTDNYIEFPHFPHILNDK